MHDEFFMNWNFISRIVHLNEWFRVETSFLCRITGSYEFLVVNDHLLLYRFSGKKCNICATYFLSNNLSFWHVERMKKKIQFTISLPVYYYTSSSSFFLEIQSNKNHLCSKCHKNILWLLWNLQRGKKNSKPHFRQEKKLWHEEK